jgi:hypothetical protein
MTFTEYIFRLNVKSTICLLRLRARSGVMNPCNFTREVFIPSYWNIHAEFLRYVCCVLACFNVRT